MCKCNIHAYFQMASTVILNADWKKRKLSALFLKTKTSMKVENIFYLPALVTQQV